MHKLISAQAFLDELVGPAQIFGGRWRDGVGSLSVQRYDAVQTPRSHAIILVEDLQVRVCLPSLRFLTNSIKQCARPSSIIICSYGYHRSCLLLCPARGKST